ncbi:hypothetical protein MCP1_140052 [Candidatus Terasakiella magnetica]|nr:hypothetical protein MCP1_140052 [Candidatus Terasakiella magnetica]
MLSPFRHGVVSGLILAAVAMGAAARAEILLEANQPPATFLPIPGSAVPFDDEPSPLVSPLQTGGIEVPVAGGRIAFPFFLFQGQQSPGAQAAPATESARTNARRSLSRAHAFSQNAYRELRKDEVKPWYTYYAPYAW